MTIIRLLFIICPLTENALIDFCPESDSWRLLTPPFKSQRQHEVNTGELVRKKKNREQSTTGNNQCCWKSVP
ncbi:hypothetical protein [Streptomyces sp. NPDC006879]|uniref:hypothetical protein n=1 Tax=Streptomyces sp. NPDC006879 TaxID=3364767 RepID=UPI0036A49575